MRIAILGAGAMGCLYGGSLAMIGHEVCFIDVSQSQINAINTEGLRLINDLGSHVIHVPAARAEDTEGVFDLVVLFTKTIHSREALASAKHLMSPQTLVLSLQNGIGNEELIADYVPKKRILIGMTGYPADFKAPGVVESHGSSFTAIMSADGLITQAACDVAAAITKAGLNCIVTPEVYSYIWEKAAFNAAMNALTGITRLPVGPMAEFGGREIAYRVSGEAASAAQALGIEVDINKVHRMLDHAFLDHYNHKPSMLQDILAKRQTEIESINGAIVRAARSAGLETPVNETLWRLIDIIQQSYDMRL